MSASLTILAKNYQNRWKFDEVLTKTILHSFLRHGVNTMMMTMMTIMMMRHVDMPLVVCLHVV